jgi:hypothetical protein
VTGPSLPLRDLSLAMRVGLTALLLVMVGGFLASAAHLCQHHAVRDEQPGLTMDDIRGAYHGVHTVAPMITQLEKGHPADILGDEADPLSAADRQMLLDWLAGDRIVGDYDNPDLGDAAPAEVIDITCLRCHARNATEGNGIGQRVPLEYLDDVTRVAFSRDINPTSIEILTISTHTHALSMATLTIVIALLALATRWPRPLLGALVLAAGVGLLADLASWWLARPYASFVWLLLAGGAVYSIATLLLHLAILADLWLPRRLPGERSPPA